MNKVRIVLMLFLGLWASTAYAIAPMNEEIIIEAQTYGRTSVQQDLQQFLTPWTSYEEKAAKIGESSERAFFYTPYLLIAHDARDKTKANRQIKVADTEKILSDYAGYYTFTAVLFGETATFAEKSSVVIKQENKTIEADDISVSVSEIAPKVAGGKVSYMAKVYVYFQEKLLHSGKPITLIITTTDKQQHSFFFDLPKLK